MLEVGDLSHKVGFGLGAFLGLSNRRVTAGEQFYLRS
jgi:hypothetical protein